jgi:hypothetical protein
MKKSVAQTSTSTTEIPEWMKKLQKKLEMSKELTKKEEEKPTKTSWKKPVEEKTEIIKKENETPLVKTSLKKPKETLKEETKTEVASLVNILKMFENKTMPTAKPTPVWKKPVEEKTEIIKKENETPLVKTSLKKPKETLKEETKTKVASFANKTMPTAKPTPVSKKEVSKNETNTPVVKSNEKPTSVEKSEKVLVFIDTCSYLKSDLNLLSEKIKKHKMKLILPMIIYKEIDNFKDNSKDSNIKTKSKKILNMIEKLTDLNLNFFDRENNKPYHSEKFVSNDDIFIGCVAFYYKNFESKIIVVSDDTGVRGQAKSFFESAKVYSIKEFQLMEVNVKKEAKDFNDLKLEKEAKDFNDLKLEKEVKDFNDMNLKEELLRGIYSCEFEFPCKIQQKAIVPIISSNRRKTKIIYK